MKMFAIDLQNALWHKPANGIINGYFASQQVFQPNSGLLSIPAPQQQQLVDGTGTSNAMNQNGQASQHNEVNRYRPLGFSELGDDEEEDDDDDDDDDDDEDESEDGNTNEEEDQQAAESMGDEVEDDADALAAQQLQAEYGVEEFVDDFAQVEAGHHHHVGAVGHHHMYAHHHHVDGEDYLDDDEFQDHQMP